MKTSGDQKSNGTAETRPLTAIQTDSTAGTRRRGGAEKNRFRVFFGVLAGTFNATLREIFDESAYDRFLQRTGAIHSTESYRAFMRDRESAMAQMPRCC